MPSLYCMPVLIFLLLPMEDAEELLARPVIVGLWESSPTLPAGEATIARQVAQVPLTIRVNNVNLLRGDEIELVDTIDGSQSRIEKPGLVVNAEARVAFLRIDKLKPFGKHTLVFRYGLPNKTKKESAPISFEVAFPAPPVIDACYDCERGAGRLRDEAVALGQTPFCVKVQVPDITPSDELQVFVAATRVYYARVLSATNLQEIKLQIDRNYPDNGGLLTVRVKRDNRLSDPSNGVSVIYQKSKPTEPAQPSSPPKPVPSPTVDDPPKVPLPSLAPPPSPPCPDSLARAVHLFRSTESFPQMPAIRLVPDPSFGDRYRAQDACVDTEPLDTLETWARSHLLPIVERRFDCPAHFPLPCFGALGEMIPTDGVVLYEGMRLLVAADGHYEVSFTAGVPAMPVTLRLQLTVVSSEGNLLDLHLPPISIVPPPSFRGNYVGSSWHVRVNGYSEKLFEQLLNSRQAKVLRQGTARFGSWPVTTPEYERLPR